MIKLGIIFIATVITVLSLGITTKTNGCIYEENSKPVPNFPHTANQYGFPIAYVRGKVSICSPYNKTIGSTENELPRINGWKFVMDVIIWSMFVYISKSIFWQLKKAHKK